MKTAQITRKILRRGTILQLGAQEMADILPENEVEDYLADINATGPFVDQKVIGWDMIYRAILKPESSEYKALKKNMENEAKYHSMHKHGDMELDEEDFEKMQAREKHKALLEKALKMCEDPRRTRLTEISSNLWQNSNGGPTMVKTSQTMKKISAGLKTENQNSWIKPKVSRKNSTKWV